MEDSVLPLYRKPISIHTRKPQLIIIIALFLVALLFTVIVCISTFSQLNNNNISARGEIYSLPGAPSVNFKQYSEYVELKNGRRIHYWFIESQNNPASDPLILWLTGGPGCSGMDAILTEWGPFLVNDDSNTLRYNEYSWNKNASILTIEAPAGVGYSFFVGKTALDDDQVALDNWETLTLFFEKFPEFKNNKLYVMGESYGGVYAPTLVETIFDRMEQFPMNITGMAIGNGKLDYSIQAMSRIQYRHENGLLDERIGNLILSNCCDGTFEQCDYHKNETCQEYADAIEELTWGSLINPYNIKKPCDLQVKYYAPYCMNCDPVTTYMNRVDVRKALNMKSLSDWALCSKMVTHNYNTIYHSMAPQIGNVINRGLKVMLYHGELDMVCDYIMGEKFTETFKYEVTKPKSEYYVNGSSAGNHTEYRNQLHFVTVKDAGHMVPTDQPAAAFHILQSFLFDKEF